MGRGEERKGEGRRERERRERVKGEDRSSHLLKANLVVHIKNHCSSAQHYKLQLLTSVGLGEGDRTGECVPMCLWGVGGESFLPRGDGGLSTGGGAPSGLGGRN